MTEPEPSPQCAVHAQAVAVFTCARCGSFACAACKTELAAVCLACFGRPAERLGVSRRARVSFALAVAAVHGLFPLAFASLWLAAREREAIASLVAPRGGEPWLQGARWLSRAALVGWAVFWAWFVFGRLEP